MTIGYYGTCITIYDSRIMYWDLSPNKLLELISSKMQPAPSLVEDVYEQASIQYSWDSAEYN